MKCMLLSFKLFYSVCLFVGEGITNSICYLIAVIKGRLCSVLKFLIVKTNPLDLFSIVYATVHSFFDCFYGAVNTQ